MRIDKPGFKIRKSKQDTTLTVSNGIVVLEIQEMEPGKRSQLIQFAKRIAAKLPQNTESATAIFNDTYDGVLVKTEEVTALFFDSKQ